MEEDPGTIGGPPLCLQPWLLTSPCPTFHSEAELVGGRNRLRRRGLLLGPPPLQDGLWASCFPRHLQVDPTLRRGGARSSGQSPPVSCPGPSPAPSSPGCAGIGTSSLFSEVLGSGWGSWGIWEDGNSSALVGWECRKP